MTEAGVCIREDLGACDGSRYFNVHTLGKVGVCGREQDLQFVLIGSVMYG